LLNVRSNAGFAADLKLPTLQYMDNNPGYC